MRPSARTIASGLFLEVQRNLPTKSFRKLWHAGTLDAKDKRAGSLEGAGLSVSQHPREWIDIATLGAVPVWECTRAGNRFLNFHNIVPGLREEIVGWGLEHGYIVRGSVWRICWYDDEWDDELCADYASEDEARADAHADEKFSRVTKIEDPRRAVLATKKLQQRVLGAAHPTIVFDCLTTVYVEDATSLDGVWWADQLDLSRLSAPRGVIVPSRVASWQFRRVELE